METEEDVGPWDFFVADAENWPYNEPMEETSFCCFCGSKLKKEFYYCPFCGTMFRDRHPLLARTPGRDAPLLMRIERLQSSLSSLEIELEELIEAGS